MDISPTDRDGIIDINIFEESALGEILEELQQRLPQTPKAELLQYAQSRIAEKANSGKVGFYLSRWGRESIRDVDTRLALQLLSKESSWESSRDELLFVYRLET